MNLPPEDNLRKEGKSSAPKLSFIRRFHCIYNVPVNFLWPVWMRNSLAQKHHSLYLRAGKEKGQKFQKEAEEFLISPPSTLSWP